MIEIIKKSTEILDLKSYLEPNSACSSEVFRTLTEDCFLSSFSSDHKIQLNFKANARYGASFVCSGNNFNDLGINLSNSSFGGNVILLSKIDNNLEKSTSERCVLDSISFLLSENSINKNSGAISSTLSEKRMASDLDVPLISKENSSLASTTTNIYLAPLSLYRLAKALFTFLPNLKASSFVNLLSDLNSFKNSRSPIFCSKAFLATADQFISENSSILCFNSPGTANVIVVILNTSLYDYINYVYIYKSFGRDIHLNTTIGEVRIYNRSLTAAEVAGLYNGTVGSGIIRIRRAVKEAGLPPPKFDFTNFFTITFKRPILTKVTEKVTENQKQILALINLNKHITINELSKKVGISEKSIKENLFKLKKMQLLKRIGPAKGGHWKVVG